MQPVTVFCSPTSLTFHVCGKAKQTQASVDIPSALFSDYKVTSQQQQQQQQSEEDDNNPNSNNNNNDWHAGGEFCINLTTLLECLSLLGTTSQLALSYNLHEEVLKLELLAESVLCTTVIPGMQLLPETMTTTTSLALAFRSSAMAARFIVTSAVLSRVVSELQVVPGATVATVSLGAEGMAVAVVGHWGECWVSIPATGSHVVALEVVGSGSTSSSTTTTKPRNYPLHALLASFQGLEIAQETCLTVNEAGMIAIQHQVVDAVVGDGNPCFVDHILCCLQDDDEEDDDEQEDASRYEPKSSYQSRNRRPYTLTDSQEEDSSPRSTLRSSIDSQQPSMSATQSYAEIRPDTSSHNKQRVSSTTASSPEVSQPRRAGWWGASTSDDSGGESENEANEQDNHDTTRLFGRLPTSTALSPRSVRPRTASPSDNRESELQSPNILLSEEQDDDDDPVVVESAPLLDVTVPVSPRAHPQQQRRDLTSSPELVYGKK